MSYLSFRYAPITNLFTYWCLSFSSGSNIDLKNVPAYFSNMSEDYRLVWKHPIENQEEYYDFYGVVKNITSNETLNLGPESMNQIKYYYPDLSTDYSFTYASHCGNVNWNSFYDTEKRTYRNLSYTPVQDENEYCTYNEVNAYDTGQGTTKYYGSPSFWAINTSHMKFMLSNNQLEISNRDIYKISESPHFWYTIFNNQNDLINATSYLGSGDFFYTQNYDTFHQQTRTYKLYEGTTLNSSGNLSSINFPASQGNWTLIINNAFKLNTINNNATVNVTFDTSIADKNPPSLKNLNLYTDGIFSDYIFTAKTNKFSYEFDPNGGTMSNVSMRYFDTSWHNIPLTTSANIYNATIPGGINLSKLRFKIIAKDNSQNTLDYEFDLLTDLGSDLKPTEINFSENVPQINNNIQLTAKIENIGIRATTDINVKLYDNAILKDQDTINAIDAANYKIANFNYTINNSGLRNITIIVDQSNDIPELNESNNQFSTTNYYLGQEEYLLTNFSDNNQTEYLSLSAGNQQLFLKLPVFSKINYLTSDIQGKKVIYSASSINQTYSQGQSSVSDTQWWGQSIILNHSNSISRIELNITPYNKTELTLPPLVKLRKGSGDSATGIDFTEASIPISAFTDDYLASSEGAYAVRSFNFTTDFELMDPSTTYWFFFATEFDPAVAAYLYRYETDAGIDSY